MKKLFNKYEKTISKLSKTYSQKAENQREQNFPKKTSESHSDFTPTWIHTKTHKKRALALFYAAHSTSQPQNIPAAKPIIKPKAKTIQQRAIPIQNR